MINHLARWTALAMNDTGVIVAKTADVLAETLVGFSVVEAR